MLISEIRAPSDSTKRLKKFAEWAINALNIENPPVIKYGFDSAVAKEKKSFGTTRSNGDIWVHVGNRSIADAARTLAHELVHFRQFNNGAAHNNMSHEKTAEIEDEANAIAGRLMRKYANIDDTIFESVEKE
jgi:Zn-dependent peptidase ImmA (M78 family)